MSKSVETVFVNPTKTVLLVCWIVLHVTKTEPVKPRLKKTITHAKKIVRSGCAIMTENAIRKKAQPIVQSTANQKPARASKTDSATKSLAKQWKCARKIARSCPRHAETQNATVPKPALVAKPIAVPVPSIQHAETTFLKEPKCVTEPH